MTRYHCDNCPDATGCPRCPIGEAIEQTWREAAWLVEAIAADPIADLSKPLLLDLIAYHMHKRSREAAGETS